MNIKLYTDIEQSKKLAEFLPLESADMSYRPYREEGGIPDYQSDLCPHKFASWSGFPCWSLAALLDYLRKIDFFPSIEADEHSVTMNINYYNEEEARPLAPVHNIRVKANTFVDACFELVLKLHELKML